jgi:alanyl-tRNA synthetase
MPKPFTAAEIREAFLAYFAEKGCVRYASASLVPENDPTTLFTVAGMSQFKDMFLGRGTHPFTRAATSQKCIRVNDILNVGRTARHHTFFEMLGHFSFNDYFKKEALRWIWEFYTQRLGLAVDRLSISVHTTDDESLKFWRDEMGIPANKIFKLGDKDNFWPANAPKEGPEGPGGYCSEIFYDLRTNNDPNDNLTSDTGRFVEIGNSVFPQFNVRKPNPDGSPNLEQLGRTNVDFGGGLERLCCVVQNVSNTFDIDLFQVIVKKVVEVTGQAYKTDATDHDQVERNVLIRRISDHVRAVTFCIVDGALPGNLGRGYVVRRLIRRATLDIDKLGVSEPRLHLVVPAVVAAMSSAYPEISKRSDLASETLKAEEASFRRTLRKGLDLLQRAIDRQRGQKIFSGDDAFELVTTHGFPKEIIADLIASEGMAIDDQQFEKRWTEHTQVSHAKDVEVFTSSALQDAKPRLGATPFVGYEQSEWPTEITLIEVAGKEVAQAPVGSAVRVALAKTPFYGESGGQVGDRGRIVGKDFEIVVTDTQKDDGLVIHIGEVAKGAARPGPVTARIDADARNATTRHHSATHLLHSALGKFLGAHVEQQGSKVEPGQLRFDYNNPQAPGKEQLAQIEDWVNQAIRSAHPVQIQELPIDDAKKMGAKAQFGEKYGAKVRVVSVGDGKVSRELCGGCHVRNTGEILVFRIIRDEALSAGVRRVTAVAGQAARDLESEQRAIAKQCMDLLGGGQADPHQVEDLARLFKVTFKEVAARVQALSRDLDQAALTSNATMAMPQGDLLSRVEFLQNELKRLRKIADQHKAQAATGAIDQVLASERDIGGIPVICKQIDGLDAKALRSLVDLVRQKKPSHFLVLGSAADGKALLAVSASADVIARGVSAGDVIGKLAAKVGGGGGGKSDVAQAGGKDPSQLPAALASVPALVLESLKAKW